MIRACNDNVVSYLYGNRLYHACTYVFVSALYYYCINAVFCYIVEKDCRIRHVSLSYLPCFMIVILHCCKIIILIIQTVQRIGIVQIVASLKNCSMTINLLSTTHHIVRSKRRETCTFIAASRSSTAEASQWLLSAWSVSATPR